MRIDFPTGASDPPLEPISWDDFFEKFDEAKLAFVYQDQKANGEGSSFCKFVDRKSADLKPCGKCRVTSPRCSHPI